MERQGKRPKVYEKQKGFKNFFTLFALSKILGKLGENYFVNQAQLIKNSCPINCLHGKFLIKSLVESETVSEDFGAP